MKGEKDEAANIGSGNVRTCNGQPFCNDETYHGQHV